MGYILGAEEFKNVLFCIWDSFGLGFRFLNLVVFWDYTGSLKNVEVWFLFVEILN